MGRKTVFSLVKQSGMLRFPSFVVQNNFENTIDEGIEMARECAVTGKKTIVGRSIVRKGLAKKKGGIGLHVTSATKRTFKPNLQRVRIRTENGTVKRVWVSAKALRSGAIKKA
jgi:large subunit ribosomal protein L28